MRWQKWCIMSLKTYTEPQKSGLLLLDKPKDFSSHDIVAICRRELQTKKIGHSGTLDPMATGLLIVLVGREATKRQSDFLKMDKVYSATLLLGAQTDSWDADGQITEERPVPPLNQGMVEEAATRLSGQIRQPIPFFSAKRVQGKHLYSLARQGVKMEQKYNEVSVQWPQVVLHTPNSITFTVHCSCGTYVRSLGYMLARELGTVGHLTQLRREAIGPFTVQQAFDAKQLKGYGTNLYRFVQTL